MFGASRRAPLPAGRTRNRIARSNNMASRATMSIPTDQLEAAISKILRSVPNVSDLTPHSVMTQLEQKFACDILGNPAEKNRVKNCLKVWALSASRSLIDHVECVVVCVNVSNHAFL
jgi:hypothetical protein